MIKCDNKCPQSKEFKCCYSCDKHLECPDCCSETVFECGCATTDEETGIELFKRQELETMKKIAQFCEQKKAIEAAEKELKNKLKAAMERWNVKSYKSDLLNITYVAESTSTQLDGTKVKKLYPKIAAECIETVKRSAYIKVEVKDGDE
jgi:hypothetical protein